MCAKEPFAQPRIFWLLSFQATSGREHGEIAAKIVPEQRILRVHSFPLDSQNLRGGQTIALDCFELWFQISIDLRRCASTVGKANRFSSAVVLGYRLWSHVLLQSCRTATFPAPKMRRSPSLALPICTPILRIPLLVVYQGNLSWSSFQCPPGHPIPSV